MVISFSKITLDARRLTASLRLGRHEQHETRGRLADLLGSPTEHNVQQTSCTMTTQDYQIRFQTGRHLHNELPGMAHTHDRTDRPPRRPERRHVGLKLVDHERIRPPPEILPLTQGELWGQSRGLQGWVVIDAQDMERLRSALRQGRSHGTSGHGMGTVALPVLERRGSQDGGVHDGVSFPTPPRVSHAA